MNTVLSYPDRGTGGDARWRGNQASLPEIYESIKTHARVIKAQTAGIDWQAIVRRVLQESCTQVKRGVWALPQYV